MKVKKFRNPTKTCMCAEVLAKDAIVFYNKQGKMIDIANKQCLDHGMKDLTTN